MPRQPQAQASPLEYATYTTVAWHNHDAFYAFWVERWKRVVDYLRSLHWRVLMEVDTKQIPEWRRFPLANWTLQFFNDWLGQFLQTRVRYSAVPDNPDSIAAAELADQVLKYLWDRTEMDYKKIDLSSWLLATGNADLRVYWNTNTGDMLPLAIPDGQGGMVPINPKTLTPDPSMKQPIMVDKGEIGCEIVPPQLVRWSFQRAQGVMVGYLLTYDDAVERYGDTMADQLSYQTVSGPLTTDLMSVFPQTLSSGMPAKEPSALIIEHYLHRSSRHPGGLWWTAADNKVLVTPPQPLPGKKVPIIHFRWIPLPGHPAMGLSPLYDITYQNKIYNEIEARMIEWLNKVVPKIIRKTGDGLKYGDFNEEPGQEVVVQPGAEPDFMSPPAYPPQFMQIEQMLANDMQFVAGKKSPRQQQPAPGEVKQGFRMPPRMTNEGDEVKLAVLNAKPSWEQLGYVLLDYVATFYTEPRVMAIVGQDKSYQWREFSGQDLANLQATIHVDELSLYTWNRQSLRDTVIGLMSTPGGNIMFAGPDGQPDRERIDAAMNATGIDVASEITDPDVLEARNENNAFKSVKFQPGQDGQPAPSGPLPQLMPWNKHETHLAEHSKIPKSLTFQTWDPAKKQAFLQHMQGHEKAIADAAQAQKQNMIDTEKQMRQVRSEAETQQDIRTELGKALVDKLVEVLGPSLVEGKTKPAGPPAAKPKE